MAPLKVCILSSEIMPFAKTGGLSDVVGALIRELAQLGHEVRAFMPLYAVRPTCASGHAARPGSSKRRTDGRQAGVCLLGANHEPARDAGARVLDRLSRALRSAGDLHVRSRRASAISTVHAGRRRELPATRLRSGHIPLPRLAYGLPAVVPEDSLCARAAVRRLEVGAHHPQHRLSGSHREGFHRRSRTRGRGLAARCRGSSGRRHQLFENRHKVCRYRDDGESHLRARDHRDITGNGHGGDAPCARESGRGHLERSRLPRVGPSTRPLSRGAFLRGRSRR